jgi:hypothetical protein
LPKLRNLLKALLKVDDVWITNLLFPTLL